MRCFVCGAEAQDLTDPTYDGKIVRCGTCGDYEITGTVLRGIDRRSDDVLKVALSKAKRRAQPGARPRIDTYCF